MKIWGIGLARTGTTSLHSALQILGYRSIHGGDALLQLFKNPASSIINRYDAFSDTPIAQIYPILDNLYPDGKFICTTRDIDSWIESMRWRYNMRDIEKTFHSNHIIYEIRQSFYGTTVFDERIFRNTYDRYHSEMREYFANRPQDLLMINITKGEGWESLCPFLEKEIPLIPFPLENRKSFLRDMQAQLRSLKKSIKGLIKNTN